MARLLFLILWGAILYFLFKLLFPSAKTSAPPDPTKGDAEPMVHDPNCNTFIPKAHAIRKRLKGKEHHFCSKECYKEYQEKLKS